MPGYASAFGRGLILGAGAALLYAAARESIAPARTQVTDARQSDDRARQADDRDRLGWIRANVINFRYLLQPVEDFYRESLGRSRFGPPPAFQQAARLALSSQVGVLVGYLSRRVLGQYDIALLGEEPLAAGKLYFVEPNLRQVEEQLTVPRDELRRWIALHEATHAHEFELHPWVRQYLNDSLRKYLRLLVEDMRGRGDANTLNIMLNRFIDNLRRGHNMIQ